MKRVLMSILMVTVILGLLASGISCTKTVYITVNPTPTLMTTPTPTPTPILTPSHKPTPTPTQPAQSIAIPEMPNITILESFQRQLDDGYTYTEYSGKYSYVQQDSTTGYLEGRVFLQGQPLSDWPPLADWPSNYPQLISGYVLVGVNIDLGNPQWLHVRPGDTWHQEENQLSDTQANFDVYYYIPGYMMVKFENVLKDAGKSVRLPDVTLVPARYDIWLRP